MRYVLFDFDGTIANTLVLALDIYNSIASKYHVVPVQKEDVPLLRAQRPQDLLKKYKIGPLKLPFLLMRMRSEIKSKIADVEPISGMPEALKAIKDKGYRLGIVTSNSSDNVKRFLVKHHMETWFDFVYSGMNILGKERVMSRLLTEKNIEKSTSVYVGDEIRDIEASKRMRIPVIAVTWGYNSHDALEKAHPTHVARNPSELLDCIDKIFGGDITI